MRRGQVDRSRVGFSARALALVLGLALCAAGPAFAQEPAPEVSQEPAVVPAATPDAVTTVDQPAMPVATEQPVVEPASPASEAESATPAPATPQPSPPAPTPAAVPASTSPSPASPQRALPTEAGAPTQAIDPASAIAEMEAAPPAAGVPDRSKPARSCLSAERKPVRRFARVQRLKGRVQASRPPATTVIDLRIDDSVCPGDLIESGPGSEAVLIAEDRTLVAIRADARLEVTEYRAERKPTDRMSLRLVKGGMRVVSGWLAKLNRAEYKVLTPTATIGIRGTDHEVLVLETASSAQPPDPPGTYNKVNRGGTLISTAAGELPLDAGQAGFADAAGTAAPTLLAQVPALFLPSEFDPEVDLFSNAAAAALASALFAFGAAVEVFDEDDESPEKPAGVVAPAAPACPDAEAAAREWLAAFDRAVSARDRAGLLALLTADARLLSKARGERGTEIESVLTPEQFTAMSIDWPIQVDAYQHRREALITRVLPPVEGEACGRVVVQSQVIEEGRLGGTDPMRLESREDYVLVQRDGIWRAIEASETQR